MEIFQKFVNSYTSAASKSISFNPGHLIENGIVETTSSLYLPYSLPATTKIEKKTTGIRRSSESTKYPLNSHKIIPIVDFNNQTVEVCVSLKIFMKSWNTFACRVLFCLLYYGSVLFFSFDFPRMTQAPCNNFAQGL